MIFIDEDIDKNIAIFSTLYFKKVFQSQKTDKEILIKIGQWIYGLLLIH